jgi:hypothetical protein
MTWVHPPLGYIYSCAWLNLPVPFNTKFRYQKMHYPKIEDPSAPAPPAPMRMHVPQMQMEEPQMQMQAPLIQTQAPPMQTQVPPVQIHIPQKKMHPMQMQAPPMQMHIPQMQMQVPPMQYQAPVAPPRPQVVIGVPPMQFQAPGAWTTGLFDCFDDVGSCELKRKIHLSYVFCFIYMHLFVTNLFGLIFYSGCLGFLCPCVAFGRVADITSRGQTCK